MAIYHSFLWLNSIACARAHTPPPPHIFIHLPVDGNLGCFHILAIVNSGAMNTGVCVSFRINFCFFQLYTQD